MGKDEHVGGPFVSLFTESKSLSRDAFEILSALWECQQGKDTIPTWKDLSSCVVNRCTHPIQATTETLIEFLTRHFKSRVGYTLINSARSALYSIIKPISEVPFGKSRFVCRLSK